MNVDHAIAAALEQAGLPTKVRGTRDLSGGCIHRVVEVSLDDGRRFVAKINDARCKPLFEEEADGLRALANTSTVIVPQPLAVIAQQSAAVLLMTLISSAPADARSMAWRQFGEDLASLHLFDINAGAPPRYGWDADNHIGSTPQSNTWCDDWVEFNATHRLGFQLRTACDAGLLDDTERRQVDQVISRLDQFVPRHPKPSLIHGDLWSGNVLPTHGSETGATQSRATCAVIDPACSISDALADIAMMRLFGGIPQDCFDAYFGRINHGLSDDEILRRIVVYQLYHVLNHVNLFGRGYAPQALGLVAKLHA
jgi:fructosamine-3-kinase